MTEDRFASLYRYELHRDCRSLQPASARNGFVCWVMLNPSTADDHVDDPTIRRVKDFSWQWGFDVLTVVNLFALRATDPTHLRAVRPEVAIGVDNDAVIGRRTAEANAVVAAWGACGPGMIRDRADEVWTRFLADLPEVLCLGLTKGTPEPRHPLYVARETTPTPYKRVD